MGKLGHKHKVPLRKPYKRRALHHEKEEQSVINLTPARQTRRKSSAEKKRFLELYECDVTRPPLGSGSQGVVSLCTARKTGEAVVCKVLKSNTRSIMHEARREASIHRKCSSHPLVATLHDTMEINGGVYMVMEYCGGGTLADLIDKHYAQHPQEESTLLSMPLELAAHVMKQLAEALSDIHGKGIAHRDIKGDNIMMMSDKRSIRLVDFGLAVAVEPNPACPDEQEDALRSWCCGTHGFIAPEALRFEASGTAVDVWSAGVLLFLMLTGEMPFAHLQEEELARRDCPMEIDFSNANLSNHARHLIPRMLDFNPKTRISAQQIMEHPWITQTLAPAPPCKKPWLDLSGLQELSMWCRAIEAEQKRAAAAVTTTTTLVW